MEERPAAELIVSTIQQFLDSCSQTRPLRDVVASLSNQTEQVPRQPATLVNGNASNEDDVGYVVPSSSSTCQDIYSHQDSRIDLGRTL